MRLLARWQLYLMSLPAIIAVLIFSYKPMYGIIIAFKDFRLNLGYFDSPWVGFENFKRLFSSYWFPIILKNTLTLSILSLIIGFPIPIILALLVNEIKNEKIKRTFQTVSYAPHFISTVVLCGMVILFTNPSQGIINKLIEALGGEAIAFMQEPEMFKWVYVLSGVWQGAGWGAVIYFAALSGVDQSLLDAASVDGASRMQKIIYINFPVLVPTIMVMLVLQCGQLLSVGYEKTLLLQNSLNLQSSEIISTYVYKMGLVNYDYSFSTAAGLFNSLCNTIILVAANMASRKMTDSSLW
ncbi:MAG: sugar ABC transporter permease [Lachnospiraceae bacterium]|nr:sugar ABC transporter permease [Lachnospiraceae bacterium]